MSMSTCQERGVRVLLGHHGGGRPHVVQRVWARQVRLCMMTSLITIIIECLYPLLHRYCGEVCRMKGWDEHKEAVLYDVITKIA